MALEGREHLGLTKAISLYESKGKSMISLRSLGSLLEALVLYERKQEMWASLVDQGLRQIECDDDDIEKVKTRQAFFKTALKAAVISTSPSEHQLDSQNHPFSR